MASQWVWPFELEEKIGEGGMGVVYRGRYIKNDLRVAVKLLPADIADPTILARFEREVKILKDLRHPNIVHSFGGVCEDKRRFYAMELVEGGSLDELLMLRGGRLPWEQVVEYGLQICSALHYAHERGIVHRDVKPGNFLLTKTGQLKLSDFGLATIVAGSKLTSTGRTVGSFRYMSPEQIRGTDEPLPSTDLYSLGCVLLQMLTGRPPFDGQTAAELLHKHLTADPPRAAQSAPDCPASLDALVDELLRKKPEDRPKSALEVGQRLKQVSPVIVLKTDPTLSTVAIQESEDEEIVVPSRKDVRKAEPRGSSAARFSVLLPVALSICVAAALMWSFALLSANLRLGEAETLWIETFRTKSNADEVRVKAAAALGRLGVHSDSAVRALENGLSDPSPQIRGAAISALGECGGNARHVILSLMRIRRRDDSPHMRQAAANSLQKIRDEPGDSPFWWYSAWIGLSVAAFVTGWLYVKRRSA